jgi:hypothetical protein
VLIAGLTVDGLFVLELARLLRAQDFVGAAERLETAHDLGVRTVGLSIGEREEILCVLDDPPEGLAELRRVLVAERAWRLSHGMGEPVE